MTVRLPPTRVGRLETLLSAATEGGETAVSEQSSRAEFREALEALLGEPGFA
jgi:hypothetical protein